MAHEHGTTVVEDRRSSAGLVTAIVAILLLVLLVWAIFFSGWFMDRGGTQNTPTQTNIEEREEGDTNIQQQQPQDTQPQDTETQAPNPGSSY